KILEKKFAETLTCKDNEKIPRVADAGRVVEDYQIMHNGLKVKVDCYSTATNKGMMTKLFETNRGVHEPSEEYAFQVLLASMNEGATIVELGAWWSFYSMWFCKTVKNAKAYMVEPIAENVEAGKHNFALNGFKGEFFQAFVGKASGMWKETKRSLLKGNYEVETKTPVICVDDLMTKFGIQFIDILHADIQGAELDMLEGARRAMKERKIRFFCISTHENHLHYDCIKVLKANDYVILCEVDLDRCMHMDGFIVARAKEMPGPSSIEVHRLDP
ncbi:MAG: FkbM family methyltransferase, partial [Bdellovibrionota bacterium]